MKYNLQMKDGRFTFSSERQKEMFLIEARKKPNQWYMLEATKNESRNQRGFYHGAILRVWAYLDGRDHTSSDVLEEMHEIAKLEFNPKVIVVAGKPYKIGDSTKFKLNDGYIEKIIDYLEENYAVKRQDCLDTEHYKDFRDRVYPSGEYFDYVAYLVALKRI